MNRASRPKATFTLAQLRQGLEALPEPPEDLRGPHRAFVSEPGATSARPDGPTLPFRHMTFEPIDRPDERGWIFSGKVLLGLDEIGHSAHPSDRPLELALASESLAAALAWPHGSVGLTLTDAQRRGAEVLAEVRLTLKKRKFGAT